MTLSTFDCLAALTTHSAGFAEVTRGNLDARVEHCPDWSVADLVWHLTEVHWFWATIAEERLDAPPDQSRRPERPDDTVLVDAFAAGAARLTRVLREADQSATCWTWAPQRQDVAFITRHQVQEAAVHHWDAVNALAGVGGRLGIEDDVAVDCVEEFLTFSVSSDADPADPPREPLAGAIWVCPCEPQVGTPSWLIEDGTGPGTLTWSRMPAGVEAGDLTDKPVLAGGHTSPDRFLLWLYGRADQPWSVDDHRHTAALARLRALAFTD
jgi:uncharacterized protein (TIGR03083 family)